MSASRELIPPKAKNHSLVALTRLKSKSGSEWNVFAYVLNRDMITADGKLDDLHAVVFPLGSFSDQELAETHAKQIIEATGHPGVVVSQYSTPVFLTNQINPEVIVEVPVDSRGKLVELESQQYKREKEEYERRIKVEQEIQLEAEAETDPDSIEHFKRQCYLAIKARANYQIHKKEMEKAWESYKAREAAVRAHYQAHPHHEIEWLPYLKEKLEERGESNSYLGLEAGYQQLRSELLGLEQ